MSGLIGTSCKYKLVFILSFLHLLVQLWDGEGAGPVLLVLVLPEPVLLRPLVDVGPAALLENARSRVQQPLSQRTQKKKVTSSGLRSSIFSGLNLRFRLQ